MILLQYLTQSGSKNKVYKAKLYSKSFSINNGLFKNITIPTNELT